MQEKEDIDSIRKKIVQEHMEAELRKDAAQTVETFSKPRYEIIPTGEVYDGAEAVNGFLQESMDSFPDFHFETHEIHCAKNAVIVEATFMGTHLNSWRGIPPTGKKVSYRMCNVFVFDGEQLICERLNFDLLTVLTQLGIARDVNSLGGKLALFCGKPHVFMMGWLRQLFGRKS